MGKMSKEKGKRGEREFSALLTEHGFEARRGVQYQGGTDSPDVVCKELDQLHFEVKRTETLSLYPAMSQATQDGGEKVPVVAHRRNGKPWLCIMKADDLLNLIKGDRHA